MSWRKRVFIGVGAAVFVLWGVIAVLYCFCVGPSFTALVSGARLPAVLLYAGITRWLRPDCDFAGLDREPAIAVLRRISGGLSPSDGRLLYDFAARNRYRRALDVGTGTGAAALWIGLAMRKTGGQLVTIELDPAIAAEARERFRQAGLSDVIDSRIDDALHEIPSLSGQFDFVFLDPGAPLNKKLLDLVCARVPPGGAIAAHNAIGFKFAQPGYLEAIAARPNLETRIVPTFSGGIAITSKYPDAGR